MSSSLLGTDTRVWGVGDAPLSPDTFSGLTRDPGFWSAGVGPAEQRDENKAAFRKFQPAFDRKKN